MVDNDGATLYTYPKPGVGDRMKHPAAWLAFILVATSFVSVHPESQAVPDSTEKILAIVVHPKNGTTDLTMDELRLIMKAEKKFWAETRNIRILMREKETWERGIILEKVFAMDENAYSRFWLKQIYRGKATAPPAVVATEEEMLKTVRDDVNAIGYADHSHVADDLVVVTIDGKKPSDGDYPLKKTSK